MKVLYSVFIAALVFSPLVTAGAVRSGHLDLRSDKAAKGNYNVAFVARGDGDVGHAFVILYADDEKQQQSIDVAYGLYPTGEDKKWNLASMPGHVVQEFLRDRAKITRRLDVRVDEAVYRHVAEHVEKEKDKTDQTWTVLWHDCVSFTRECADIAGLKLPSRLAAMKPEEAVSALIEENQ